MNFMSIENDKKNIVKRMGDFCKSEKTKVSQKNYHIYDWAEKLIEVDPELAKTMQETQEDRLSGLKKLVELNLPRYQYVQTSIENFLLNPNSFFSKLRGNKYYPKLLKDDGFRQYRLDCSKEQTIEFVRGEIRESFTMTDTLVLSEFFQNHYGGHIVIHNDGECYGEIVRGECSGLTYGREIPILTIALKNFLGTFEYKNLGLERNSEEFEELVQAFNKALAVIPQISTDNPHISYRRFKEQIGDCDDGRLFKIKHPGYYEFIFTRFADKDNYPSSLQPIFFDYRGVSLYQIRPDES
jgi:hypothetical protein